MFGWRQQLQSVDYESYYLWAIEYFWVKNGCNRHCMAVSGVAERRTWRAHRVRRALATVGGLVAVDRRLRASETAKTAVPRALQQHFGVRRPQSAR